MGQKNWLKLVIFLPRFFCFINQIEFINIFLEKMEILDRCALHNLRGGGCYDKSPPQCLIGIFEFKWATCMAVYYLGVTQHLLFVRPYHTKVNIRRNLQFSFVISQTFIDFKYCRFRFPLLHSWKMQN